MSVEGVESATRGREADPVARALELARHFRAAKRWGDAERVVRDALASAPDHPYLHFELAVSLVNQERPAEAEASLDRAIGLDPGWPPPFSLRGAIRQQEGRYGEAERDMLEALRLGPDWSPSYVTYARLMYATGHLDKAEKLLERALALDPQHEDAHSLLAVVHAEGERHRTADRHARRGLALAPGGAAAQANAGLAHLNGGRPFLARRELREALRLDPTEKEYERLWLEADKACRPTYVPFYYWSLVVRRLPGQQFSVWIGFIGLGVALRTLEWDSLWVVVLALFCSLFFLYTWVADALTDDWIRLFPPR